MTAKAASSAVTQLQQQLGRFNILGMYDSIVIPKSRLLGIDEKINKYLSLIEDEEITFQTKDFDQTLSTYYVKGDSLMYKKGVYEWVDDANHFLHGYMKTVSEEIVPDDITTTIICYDYFNAEPLDITIHLKIVFIKGKVDEISLHTYEEEDSKARIERSKKRAEESRKELAFRKTFLGKCQRVLRKFLFKISIVFLRIGDKIQKLSFKI